MDWIKKTETLTQRSPLPPGTSSARAIALLQNHDFVLRLDPEYVSHILQPTPPLACSGRQTHIDAKHYTVTDHMDALPRGLWDSTVTFEAVLTPTRNGTHWKIDGPLGYVQTSLWGIEGEEGREGEEGNLELVERAEIRASWGLVGIIKKKILANSLGIHKKFLKELAKEKEAGAGSA